jgi:Activator of Hsp90 ATPase homolog 1-like protein
MPTEMPNKVAFKATGNGKTGLTITEYDWPVGQMMEMSKTGMEQCLDKMAASLAKAQESLYASTTPYLRS